MADADCYRHNVRTKLESLNVHPGGKIRPIATRSISPRGSMVNETESQSIAFGRARIETRLGETFEQPVRAIICPANARGIMSASGSYSLRSLAGADIERTTMALAPLQLGSALATSSGKLQEQGIERLIHAVVTDEPGGQRQLPVVRRAIGSALEVVYGERLQSLAIPLMTGSHITSPDQLRYWIEAIVDDVVSHVRRDRVRLEQVVLVSRYPDDLEILSMALTAARVAAWPA